MKKLTIAGRQFSKVLCGTNAFYGKSHFSEARDEEYRARFNDEMVERVVRRAVDMGVNTVESSANERILSILSKLREGGGETIRFVGSTRIDETSPLKSHQEKLTFLIERRADICVIHAQFVDRVRKGNDIEGLPRMVDAIHEAGLLAGISTHQVRTVELCENRGYGLDAYMFPLNLSGFVYPGYRGTETVKDRVDIVQGVSKPFILIKVLGAGRIPPADGLSFIAENAKPGDLISLGFGSEKEVEESVGLVEKLFGA